MPEEVAASVCLMLRIMTAPSSHSTVMRGEKRFLVAEEMESWERNVKERSTEGGRDQADVFLLDLGLEDGLDGVVDV